MPGGERYGPASLPVVNQWIQEGRVLPTTTLQNVATGQVKLAKDVSGLVWTPMQPNDPYAASNPYSSPKPTGNSGFQQYGGPYHDPYSRSSNQPLSPFGQSGAPYPRPEGDRLASKSLLMSALSFVCCPICVVFALYLAYRARAEGSRSAATALWVSWIVTVIWILGILNIVRMVGIFM